MSCTLSIFRTSNGTFMGRDTMPPITCESVEQAKNRIKAIDRDLRRSGGWIISATVTDAEGKKQVVKQGHHPAE
jgi:hypothetical protein